MPAFLKLEVTPLEAELLLIALVHLLPDLQKYQNVDGASTETRQVLYSLVGQMQRQMQ